MCSKRKNYILLTIFNYSYTYTTTMHTKLNRKTHVNSFIQIPNPPTLYIYHPPSPPPTHLHTLVLLHFPLLLLLLFSLQFVHMSLHIDFIHLFPLPGFMLLISTSCLIQPTKQSSFLLDWHGIGTGTGTSVTAKRSRSCGLFDIS